MVQIIYTNRIEDKEFKLGLDKIRGETLIAISDERFDIGKNIKMLPRYSDVNFVEINRDG